MAVNKGVQDNRQLIKFIILIEKSKIFFLKQMWQDKSKNFCPPPNQFQKAKLTNQFFQATLPRQLSWVQQIVSRAMSTLSRWQISNTKKNQLEKIDHEKSDKYTLLVSTFNLLAPDFFKRAQWWVFKWANISCWASWSSPNDSLPLLNTNF